MKSMPIVCLSVAFLGLLSADEITIKIKTTPDFPQCPPPQTIIWDGSEVGLTNPGKSVPITVDLTGDKKTLQVGETKMNLWKAGLGIKGEVLSGKAKMKEGPTLVIKSKLSSDEVLSNIIEFFPNLQETLASENLTINEKTMYNRLLTNILNYEFTTENIVASVTNMDPESDQVSLTFSYYGFIEKTWNDSLKLKTDSFSGKKPKAGHRARTFSDHFTKIPKRGILKISRDGELSLVSVKTEKYKWGTYKKDRKKKKKYILPVTFYVK